MLLIEQPCLHQVCYLFRTRILIGFLEEEEKCYWELILTALDKLSGISSKLWEHLPIDFKKNNKYGEK